MRPYLHSAPFLARYQVDLTAAAAAYRSARIAAQEGRAEEASRFRQIATHILDRLEELYTEEHKKAAVKK